MVTSARARPDHPKDGRRLAPAARLFALAEHNLAPFGPYHLGLDVAAVLALGSALFALVTLPQILFAKRTPRWAAPAG